MKKIPVGRSSVTGAIEGFTNGLVFYGFFRLAGYKIVNAKEYDEWVKKR